MNVLDFVGGTGWAITEAAAEQITQIALRQHEVSPETLAAYRAESLARGQRVTARDGVAILDVTGPLFKKASFFTSMSGATSYATLRTDLQVALDDASIHSILLNIDSPGGEANGCDELAGAIRAASAIKPITAFVSGQAASGGFWIAASAPRIVVSKAAMLGSIGVVLGLTETAPRAGETKLQFVSAQSPNKRPDLATQEGRSQIQAMVDDLAEVFVNDIAAFRGITPESVVSRFGAGGIKIGAKAVAAGMADEVGDFETLIQSMISARGSRPPQKANVMSQQHHFSPNAGVVASAMAAEQHRSKAILTCDDAKQMPAFADLLTFETDVSAAGAFAILAAVRAGIGNLRPANLLGSPEDVSATQQAAKASWAASIAAGNGERMAAPLGAPLTPSAAAPSETKSAASWSSVIAVQNKMSGF